jgi:hypothetical protein
MPAHRRWVIYVCLPADLAFCLQVGHELLEIVAAAERVEVYVLFRVGRIPVTFRIARRSAAMARSA